MSPKNVVRKEKRENLDEDGLSPKERFNKYVGTGNKDFFDSPNKQIHGINPLFVLIISIVIICVGILLYSVIISLLETLGIII